MRARRAGCFVWLVSAAACACSARAQATTTNLRDTTGATFQLACDAGGACELTPTGATPAAPGCGDGAPSFSYTWARFVEICEASQHDAGMDLRENTCRIVACASDSDCPTLDGAVFACVNRLCQAADDHGTKSVAAVDAVLLCIGSAPRLTGCPNAAQDPAYVAAEAAVNAACPGELQNDPYSPTCAVPGGCVQP